MPPRITAVLASAVLLCVFAVSVPSRADADPNAFTDAISRATAELLDAVAQAELATSEAYLSQAAFDQADAELDSFEDERFLDREAKKPFVNRAKKNKETAKAVLDRAHAQSAIAKQRVTEARNKLWELSLKQQTQINNCCTLAQDALDLIQKKKDLDTANDALTKAKAAATKAADAVKTATDKLSTAVTTLANLTAQTNPAPKPQDLTNAKCAQETAQNSLNDANTANGKAKGSLDAAATDQTTKQKAYDDLVTAIQALAKDMNCCTCPPASTASPAKTTTTPTPTPTPDSEKSKGHEGKAKGKAEVPSRVRDLGLVMVSGPVEEVVEPPALSPGLMPIPEPGLGVRAPRFGVCDVPDRPVRRPSAILGMSPAVIPYHSRSFTRIDIVPKPGQQDYENRRQIRTKGEGNDPAKDTVPPGVTFKFLGPALFPLTRFANLNQKFPGEGVTIVEGMSVQIWEDGSYTIRFLAEAVAMPVTLRLQLVAEFDGDEQTITLPPMNLTPDLSDDDVLEGDTFQVIHDGFSPFLAEWMVRRETARLQLRRRGTARFGSGVPPSVIGLR